MTQPTFTLTDNKTGQQFTAAEAEQWLIRVISDPARVHSNWEHLADIDWWLLVLAIWLTRHCATRCGMPWETTADRC